MSRLTILSVIVAAAVGPATARAETAASEEIRAKDVGDAPTAAFPSDKPRGGTPDDLSPIDGVVGHFGLGYFTSAAPIGMRYWWDRTTGLDVGVDFALSSGDANAHRYGLDLGYVMALAHYHYSVVFARAALSYRFLDTFGGDALPARHDIGASAFVGAELFLGAFGFPNISLLGGYGIAGSYTYHAGSAFIVGTATPGLSITGTGSLGFHIYL